MYEMNTLELNFKKPKKKKLCTNLLDVLNDGTETIRCILFWLNAT